MHLYNITKTTTKYNKQKGPKEEVPAKCCCKMESMVVPEDVTHRAPSPLVSRG